MNRILLLTFLFLFSFTYSYAQQNEKPTCGHDEAKTQSLLDNPGLQKIFDARSKSYREYLKEKNQTNILYTIPVVVHIMHAGSAIGTTANPTDGSIETTINESSQRFRHSHSGAETYTNPFYGADTEIEFCLASEDPNGNYTTGIVRHYDPNNSEGTIAALRSGLESYAWDLDNYCNIFIVEDLYDASGVYVFSFSGGNATQDYTIFNAGSFWSGLIAHEIGHYFSLDHTFQGGCPNNDCLSDGDEVCDTPPKGSSGFNGASSCASPNNQCTTDDDDTSTNNPYRPVGMGGMGDQPDMLANYLDYTGSCWDSFTEGQKDKMQSNIANNRSTLAENTAICSAQSTPSLDVCYNNMNVQNNCNGELNVIIGLKNCGTSTLTSATINLLINDVQTDVMNWTGSLAQGSMENVTFLVDELNSAGTYKLTFETVSPNGGTDAFANNSTAELSITIEANFFQPEPPINCEPTGTVFGAGGINNFTLTKTSGNVTIISNSSSSAGTAGNYEEFICGEVFELETNTAYDVSVALGNCANSVFERSWIYIDYDNSGTFETSERVATTLPLNTSYCGGANLSFTTPSTPVQNTVLRMRVISDNSISNSCDNPSVGQSEDYGIHFGELLTNDCPNGPTEDASFTFADFCEGEPNSPVITGTTGGVFSFNPTPGDGATISASTGEIMNENGGTSYSVQYHTLGMCPDTSVVSVMVDNSLTPSFSTIGPFCQGDVAPSLPTTSNNGISGTWNPSIINTANSGTFTYVFTPTGGQCAASVNILIIITPGTTPTFTQLGPYCQNETPATLPNVSNNGISGIWNPSSINTSNPGSFDYTFTPTGGQCAASYIMTVLIDELTIPTFSQLGPYCQGTTPGTLQPTSINGITGVWNPASISTATAGTFTFTFIPNPNQCAASTTMDVLINPGSVALFSVASPQCVSAGTYTPTVDPTQTSGGTWIMSPSGSIHPITGAINLAATGIGTFTVSYFVGAPPCNAVYMQSLEIIDSGNANFTVSSPQCATGTYTPTPDPNQTSGGIWSMSPSGVYSASTGLIDLAATGAGTYVLTYTVGASPCDATHSETLLINPLTPDINEFYAGCQGDGYSYTSPSGTVYNEANPVGTETLIDANGCPYNINVDLTFMNGDDASFSFDHFCVGTANGAYNIATPGGTFALNPDPFDGASISASTGEIFNGIAGSAYVIEYTTASNCPNSSIQVVNVLCGGNCMPCVNSYCEEDFYIYDNVDIPNGTFFKVYNFIQTIGQVRVINGHVVFLAAGDYLEFLPGFEVELGAEFDAVIEECPQSE